MRILDLFLAKNANFGAKTSKIIKNHRKSTLRKIMSLCSKVRYVARSIGFRFYFYIQREQKSSFNL